MSRWELADRRGNFWPQRPSCETHILAKTDLSGVASVLLTACDILFGSSFARRRVALNIGPRLSGLLCLLSSRPLLVPSGASALAALSAACPHSCDLLVLWRVRLGQSCCCQHAARSTAFEVQCSRWLLATIACFAASLARLAIRGEECTVAKQSAELRSLCVAGTRRHGARHGMLSR